MRRRTFSNGQYLLYNPSPSIYTIRTPKVKTAQYSMTTCMAILRRPRSRHQLVAALSASQLPSSLSRSFIRRSSLRSEPNPSATMVAVLMTRPTWATTWNPDRILPHILTRLQSLATRSVFAGIGGLTMMPMPKCSCDPASRSLVPVCRQSTYSELAC